MQSSVNKETIERKVTQIQDLLEVGEFKKATR
jgi:hypothetical protein